MVFFVYEPLFAFPGLTQWLVSLAESAEDFHAFHRLHCLRAPVAFPCLTPSDHYPSPKVLKISVVFFVYIIYAPVCFSRPDTQWLLSLAESA